MSLVFRQDSLEKAIAALAAAGGSDAAEAKLVAENLVMANLSGHDSHGIGMMPRYVEALLEGGLHANRKPEVKLDAGALLVLDGRAGYGQSIGREATSMAIARAKQHGTAIVALGNSHHLGRIGHWAEMAVAEGLVSMHFVNVRSFVRVAHNKRAKVPLGWLIDDQGNPSDDPRWAWCRRWARCCASASTRVMAWRWPASCSAAR